MKLIFVRMGCPGHTVEVDERPGYVTLTSARCSCLWSTDEYTEKEAHTKGLAHLQRVADALKRS